jgi:hypothetical protein
MIHQAVTRPQLTHADYLVARGEIDRLHALRKQLEADYLVYTNGRRVNVHRELWRRRRTEAGIMRRTRRAAPNGTGA